MDAWQQPLTWDLAPEWVGAERQRMAKEMRRQTWRLAVLCVPLMVGVVVFLRWVEAAGVAMDGRKAILCTGGLLLLVLLMQIYAVVATRGPVPQMRVELEKRGVVLWRGGFDRIWLRWGDVRSVALGQDRMQFTVGRWAFRRTLELPLDPPQRLAVRDALFQRGIPTEES